MNLSTLLLRKHSTTQKWNILIVFFLKNWANNSQLIAAGDISSNNRFFGHFPLLAPAREEFFERNYLKKISENDTWFSSRKLDTFHRICLNLYLIYRWKFVPNFNHLNAASISIFYRIFCFFKKKFYKFLLCFIDKRIVCRFCSVFLFISLHQDKTWWIFFLSSIWIRAYL